MKLQDEFDIIERENRELRDKIEELESSIRHRNCEIAELNCDVSQLEQDYKTLEDELKEERGIRDHAYNLLHMIEYGQIDGFQLAQARQAINMGFAVQWRP